MADRYWKGGRNGADDDLDGDFNHADNWQSATGGAGAVPVAADKIIFDKKAGIVPSGYAGGAKQTVGKHYNCYVNMASCPDDAQGCVISEDFTGRIGIDSEGVITRLELSLAAGKILSYCGTEPCYIKIATAAKVIPLTVHNTASGLLVLSAVNKTTCDFTKAECFGTGGTLQFEDNTRITGGVYNFGQPTIIVGETSPAMKVYNIGGGLVYIDSPTTELENFGGEMHVGQTSLLVPAEDLDIASALNFGGDFYWRARGKWTAGKVLGGHFYIVGSGDKQIGNAGEIIEVNGGVLDASGQQGALVLDPTPSKILCKVAGGFIPPAGMQIDGWTMQI